MAEKKDNSTLTASKTDQELKEPDLYTVLLHNDHYSTMEFVVMILEQVFRKNNEDAVRIMMDVHKKGTGRVGLYTRDIAETKVEQVRQMAKSEGFPLKCSLERV